MVLCLAEPPMRFFIHFVIHFQATLPCHRHSTLASQASEGLHQLWAPLWLLLIALLFRLPQTLWFWVGIFYPQVFFYLTLLPQIFNSTCVCQGLPESRQFYLEDCRVSYWSSKHKSGPSVCLIHTNPLNLYLEEFVFKFYQILYELLVVKV